MSDEDQRQALLKELEGLSSSPVGIRRFFGQCTVGELQARIEDARESRRALAAAGGSPVGMHFQASRLMPAS